MNKKLQSGHRVLDLPHEENEEQKRLFKGYAKGCVKLYPGGWFFTKSFADIANKVYNFQFRRSDTVIMTFPKCGTTWMQEIVYNMKHPSNLENPLEGVSVNVKCPFIEADFFSGSPNMPMITAGSDIWRYFEKYCPGKDIKDGVFLQLAQNIPDPRIFKTHLPFTLLSPNLLNTCKVIFVVRNPKDVILSFYYHSLIVKVHEYLGDFDTFLDLFLKGNILFGPYWEMLEEGWERRNHPNFKLVYYEDLKKNPFEEISSLNDFLQTRLNSETIKKIVEETSFTKMKERDLFAGNSNSESSIVISEKGSFFRSGKSGNWKVELSEEQNAKIDEWIEKHASQGRNFSLKYSI